MLTNAECPIEIEDWQATVKKMDDLSISLTIMSPFSNLMNSSCSLSIRGVDFDDEELPFTEPQKSIFKVFYPLSFLASFRMIIKLLQGRNEEFFRTLTSNMEQGVVGNCTFALQEIAKPDITPVRSALIGTILRLGDVDTRAEEAIEILVKVSKCTSMSRPKSWKKYALREDEFGQPVTLHSSKSDDSQVSYIPLKMRTEYYVDQGGSHKDDEGDIEMEKDGATNLPDGNTKSKDGKKEENLEKVDMEELVRGFKYGMTYTPCPDGQFPRLQTKKGMDICGFFPAKRVCFTLSLGEYLISHLSYAVNN